MSKITFDNSNNQFFNSLKTGVDDYFSKNNISKTGDIRLYVKTFLLIGSAIAIYLMLLFLNFPVLISVLLCSFLGAILACIGFSVMHDANHGSYSKSNKVNDFIGLIASNGLGANAYFWKQKHNIIHHTYTNVDGIDDDIAKSPIIRQCETQKWVPMHKIQHLYMPFVYSLSSIFWIFFMDFTKYFSRKIYTTEAWKMSTKEHLIFWLTKVYYISVYMIVPMYLCGWQHWIIGYFIMNMSMGLVLSFVFQLAHVVEITEFEHVPFDTTKHLETAWAEHQIRTTCNFAMSNKVISWFVGGLNFQIEHHLFPKVSHVHYPAISKIVQQKCKEFDLPYNHYPSVLQALSSHFRFMKSLGQRPVSKEAELLKAA